jgi:Zn-dependent membrane protease YugP
MFIYQIGDTDKVFTFRRKIYKTPCVVTLKSLKEAKVLRSILDKEGINDVKVKEKGKRTSYHKKVCIHNGNRSVNFSTSIKGTA